MINNYSPKWVWLEVDIYLAKKRRDKIPLTLATDTKVNSIFS